MEPVFISVCQTEGEVFSLLLLFSHSVLSNSLWPQVPLYMGFPRQEYWSGLSFPSPGDLPDSGIEPSSPTLQADSLPSEPPGNPLRHYSTCQLILSCPTEMHLWSLKEVNAYIKYTTYHVYRPTFLVFPHLYVLENLLAMQETQVWLLGQEDPLEKEMTTHSTILAWRIPWTEEPGGLHPWGLKELDTTEWMSLHY